MVGSYDCKPIRAIENDAVDVMMHRGVVPQEILFKGWVTLVEPSGELLDHIMVVSNLRVTLLRSSEFLCTMTSSIPIMSLQSISASANENEPEVKVVFQSDVLTFISPQRRDAVQALMFASAAFSNGMLSVFRPQLNLPSALASGFVQPVLDAHETFLASLFAMSDFVGVPMRSEALSYLLACFANNVREFSFGSWSSNNNKVLKDELSSISTALSFSRCFRSIVIDDVALNESLMGSIASILSHNRHVRSLELQKTKLSKNAVLLLTRKMSSAQNHLSELTIASSTLYDAGGEALAEALMAFRKPLSKLVLQDCCLGGKALRAICIVLQKPIWLECLKMLGLGSNRFAKDDAVFLASVLRQCTALNVLDVSNSWRTPKALNLLLTALRDNAMLSNDVMNWINVSGSKLSSDAVGCLCGIVRSTASLRRLFLRNCGLKRDNLVALLDAINANAAVDFELSLDGNPLAFGAVVYEHLHNLQHLDVSRCALGKSGVTALCRALATNATANVKGLTSLMLDCNEKSSLLFGTGGGVDEDALGGALVALLEDVPTLSALSVGGDDAHHWGAALNPLLDALGANRTLKTLNLVGAKLPESSFARLFTMVATNDFMSVLSLDRNRFTAEHVEALADAVVRNRRLTDSAAFIPRLDIAAICGAHRRAETRMRAAVERITRHLDQHTTTTTTVTSTMAATTSTVSVASSSTSSSTASDVSDKVVFAVVTPPTPSPAPSPPLPSSQQQQLLAEPGGTLVRHFEKSFRSFMPSDWRQRRSISYNPPLEQLFVPENADQQHKDDNDADLAPPKLSIDDKGDNDVGDVGDDNVEQEVVKEYEDIEYDTDEDDDDVEDGEENDVREGDEHADVVFNSKGHKVYELHKLRIGQEFPLDVVASQREKHLSDSAFERVFNMRFEQFEALPKWRQLILKKAAQLF